MRAERTQELLEKGAQLSTGERKALARARA